MSFVADRKIKELKNKADQNALKSHEIAHRFGAILAERYVEEQHGQFVFDKDLDTFVAENSDLLKMVVDEDSSIINGITETLEDMGYYESSDEHTKLLYDIVDTLTRQSKSI